MNEINQRVRAIRKKNGLTLQEMADKLRMNRTTYSAKELKGNFSIPLLKKICFLFGEDFQELIGDSNYIDYTNRVDPVTYNFNTNTPPYTIDETPTTTLTSNEQKIINTYRALSREKRAELFDYVKSLSEEIK